MGVQARAPTQAHTGASGEGMERGCMLAWVRGRGRAGVSAPPRLFRSKNLIMWVVLVVSCLVGGGERCVLNPPGCVNPPGVDGSRGPSMAREMRDFWGSPYHVTPHPVSELGLRIGSLTPSNLSDSMITSEALLHPTTASDPTAGTTFPIVSQSSGGRARETAAPPRSLSPVLNLHARPKHEERLNDMPPPDATEARDVATCGTCQTTIYASRPDNTPVRSAKLVWKHTDPAIDVDHSAIPAPTTGSSTPNPALNPAPNP